MRKALVIGPRYYNFLDAVETAFRDIGWECLTLGYDNPVDPYTTLNRILYKCGSISHRERMLQDSRRLFSARALETFEKESPDLVFLMNGDMVETAALDRFRSGAKVSLWLFDNISKMPSAMTVAGHCDRLYSFDRNDVNALREAGLDASFLPQACDTSIYRPLGSARDTDILFVGDLYYYPNRQRLLKAVIDAFPQKKIRIIGSYKPWYKNPVKCLFRERRDIYTNHGIEPAAVNEWYNRSRVVLNIHREDQKDGANPRVFEICSSGAYQVCDRNPYIESLFPCNEVGLYEGADELVRQIREALDNDKSVQAAAAHRLVVESHSYQSRVRQIVLDAGF